MVLLDINGDVVPSPGTTFGNYISFVVTYPTLFNDTDSLSDKHSFLTQDFVCLSEYYTDPGNAHNTVILRVID